MMDDERTAVANVRTNATPAREIPTAATLRAREATPTYTIRGRADGSTKRCLYLAARASVDDCPPG